jgi:hypothetical protein
MLTKTQIRQFRKFCKELDKYNFGTYALGSYFNACGNNDEFAFEDSDWDESQSVRTDFENWINKNFPNYVIDSSFNPPTLILYEMVAKYDGKKL